MVDVTLSMGIDAREAKAGADVAVRSLDDIRKKAGEAVGSLSNTEKSMNALSKTSSVLRTAFISLAAAIGIKNTLQAIDSYKLLEARIKLVTSSTKEQIAVSQKLFEISNKNRTNFEDTVRLYTRIAQSAKDYGVSQREIIQITQTAQQAIKLSGATAAEASASITQFAQALGSGKLQGDELRSLFENSSRLVKAIADNYQDANGKVGVTIGQLRKLGEEGKLTTSTIVEALKKASPQIAAEASQIPLTIADALTYVSNQYKKFVFDLDSGVGLTSKFAEAIKLLGDGIGQLGKVIDYFGIGFEAVIGSLIKGVITVNSVLEALSAGFTKTFEYIGSLFSAFKQDLAEFIDNPFDSGGFDKLQAALADGFTGAFRQAYDSVRQEGLDAVKGINDKITEDALAVGKKYSQTLDENAISATKTGKAVAQLTKEQEALIKKRQDAIKEATTETAQAVRLAEASGISAQKYEEVKNAIERENALRKLKLTITSAEGKKLDELLKKQQEEAKIIEVNNKLREEQINLENAQRLKDGFKQSPQQYDKIQDAIERENELRGLGITLETKQGKLLDETLKKRQEIERQLEREQRAVENAAAPFIEASKNIQNGLASNLEEAIKEGLDKGFKPGNFLKRFGDLLKSTIISSIANGLAASLTGGFINPFLQGAATLFNGSAVGGSVGQTLGVGASGAGGLGGIANIFSAGKSLLSLGSLAGPAGGTGIFTGLGGIGTSLAGGINSFGASLGFGGVSPSFVEPLLPGTGVSAGAGALSATSLTGVLGGAGIGAFGGGLIAGLTGGNQLGGSIGGGIGGAIGTAILPGVGTVIGSALGGLVGGLFGGGKKTVASEFAGNLSNNTLGDLSYGSKGTSTDTAKGLAAALGSFIQNLNSIGVNVSNASIRGGTNSKRGNAINIKSGDLEKSFAFDPGNQDSVTNAIASIGVELAKGANAANKSLTTALQNIKTEGRKVEDIVNDLAFAANFDKLGDAPKKVSALEESIKALNAKFDEAAETAKRLGLSEEKLSEYRAKQFDLLRKDFNDSIDRQILEILNPTAAALDDLNKQFEEIRSNAKLVGGDLSKVEALYGLQARKILDQQIQQQTAAQQESLKIQVEAQNKLIDNLQRTKEKFDGFAKSLDNFRKSLLLDKNLSPLSPQQRLEQARQLFEQTAALAQSGDEDAINKLEDYGRTFLEASKEFNASSEAYFNDFNRVQAVLQQTQSVAEQQASIANQQLTTAQQQLAALQAIQDQLSKQASAAAQAANSNVAPANPNQNFGKNPELNRQLAAVTNYRGDFGSGGFSAYIAAASQQEKDRANAVLAANGITSRYATGGDFMGGLRIVGERGPELEATGRARIYNAEETRRILTPANDTGVADRLDTLIRLSKTRMTQSAAETDAIRSDLNELKASNAQLSSQLNRLLSRPA